MAAKGFDPNGPLDPSRALVPAVVRVNTQTVRRGFWPKIRKLAPRIPFAGDAVALWFCARDAATPTGTKAMLMAALAYFVVPTDVLPDWFVGLGFTDDAAVIAAAIGIAGRAIKPVHREAAKALLARMAED
ncbi:MAG: hypothetical protein B7Y99_13060 [Caulobacterales bacterium 32-69-10]|nr:MAG: hypothetical protein B7Y99_13060 [Caulobacterales bacterium 32-69-10]